MRRFYHFLLLLTLSVSVYSGEVDNFRHLASKPVPLAVVVVDEKSGKQSKLNLGELPELIAPIESTIVVNEVINNYIKQLSKVVKDCSDREQIMLAIRYIFDTNFPDVVIDMFEYSPMKEKFIVAFHKLNSPESIYKGFNHPSYSGCCSSVHKVNGHIIGADKVDHFLSHGFMYYRRYSEKTEADPYSEGQKTMTVLRTDSQERRIDDALAVGIFQEESSWGLAGTGIKSYGDLASNYQGLLFYKDLLETDKYLKCENNKFVVTGEFTIANYIDDAWDESINCSSYNSTENRDAVVNRMKDYGLESCPVAPKKCEELVKKYKEIAAKILHPLCINPKSEHNQVEPARNKLISFFGMMEHVDPRDLRRAAKGAK